MQIDRLADVLKVSLRIIDHTIEDAAEDVLSHRHTLDPVILAHIDTKDLEYWHNLPDLQGQEKMTMMSVLMTRAMETHLSTAISGLDLGGKYVLVDYWPPLIFDS